MNDHKSFAEVVRDEPVPNPERVRALVASAVREERDGKRHEAGDAHRTALMFYFTLAAAALIAVVLLTRESKIEPARSVDASNGRLAGDEEELLAPEESQEDWLKRAVACLRATAPHEGISILILEGEPRFEYRHLKTDALRWKSAAVRTWLCSADAEFAQECSEGGEPVLNLNEEYADLAAWLRHDVIVLGDCDPKALPENAAENIRRAVMDYGRGLFFIAGQTHFQKWLADPNLAQVLPMLPFHGGAPPLMWTIEPAEKPQAGVLTSWIADALHLQMAAPEMHWLVRPLEIVPGARVELILDGAPLLVQGRAGFGQVAFAAGDELWRLRPTTFSGIELNFFKDKYRELAPYALLDKNSPPGHVQIIDNAARAAVNKTVRFAADARNGEGFQLAPTATLRRPGVNEEVPLPFTLKPELGCSVAEFVPGTPGEYVVTIQCDISGGMQPLPGDDEEAERLRWRTEVRRIFVSR